MSKDEVKKYLQSLTTIKLAELFYEVAREKGSAHSKLSLAECCFSLKTSPVSINLVAITAEVQSNSNSHRGDFVNFGLCNNCKANVTSWSKDALCPICGEKVGLT